MALVVQKYGGTSVGDIQCIDRVAGLIARRHERGDQLVVVVSAMSGVTDSLLRLARQVHPDPMGRELDFLLATGEQTTTALLAMALHAKKIRAVPMTGAQAGIVTDGSHTRARILNIGPKRIHRFLSEGAVVVVAGFQGQDLQGSITTLGRGGSDLTAIALAAVLRADLCEICTDVDGVYTADPRLVPNATKLDEISYDEMLEMAASGSKVMQSRSVEFAKKFSVVFEVRSTFSDMPGTIVKAETKSMEGVVVRGVSLERNQAKLTVPALPDRPGVAAKIFSSVAAHGVSVDMIVQNVSDRGQTDITFTVDRDSLARALSVVEPVAAELGAARPRAQQGVAKLSVVGIGMRSHSGVAARLFQALADAGVNAQMISTSEIKISVVIHEESAQKAVCAVHEAFGLAGPSAGAEAIA
ncbi:MAG: aspartate kinase [Candidatus Methylacidiphilaceae bacterium]